MANSILIDNTDVNAIKVGNKNVKVVSIDNNAIWQDFDPQTFTEIVNGVGSVTIGAWSPVTPHKNISAFKIHTKATGTNNDVVIEVKLAFTSNLYYVFRQRVWNYAPSWYKSSLTVVKGLNGVETTEFTDEYTGNEITSGGGIGYNFYEGIKSHDDFHIQCSLGDGVYVGDSLTNVNMYKGDYPTLQFRCLPNSYSSNTTYDISAYSFNGSI